MLNTFGRRLRILREDAGLTQNELRERVLERTGVTMGISYISEIERNDRAPSVTVAAALARGLDTSLDYLTLLTDDPMMQFVVTQALYAPVQLPLWYAPMFVAWHRLPPGKAMFFSVVAVLRNKGAFLQYVAAWAALALAASLCVQVLLLAFGMSPLLVLFVFLPLSLVMPTAVYCSFWPTYRDAVTGT